MFGLLCFVVVLSLASNCCFCDESPPPACSSEIYCHGPLLRTVQKAKIYEDSKEFVDMKMKYSPNETINNFDRFIEEHPNPNRLEVIKFVDDNFESAGQEFEEWIPDDWIAHPKFVDEIKDDDFKKWAIELNRIWKDLGRKMKKEVEINQLQYSIIWVPHPVIVPGGRFREFYYWDSYWIMQGLLLSQMDTTVKGMLENFLYIVDKYGHIPNGGRIYYLQRSQPPLLLPMIQSYVHYTHNSDFIAKHLATMEREFDYWMTNHTRVITKNGKNYTVAVYGDFSSGPRPESYSEDIESAEIFKDDDKKEKFYSELKAAAESGWDFSSRWFISNATNKGNLTHTKIRSIVPVDLNAMIYWNADILAEFNNYVGNTEKAAYYSKKAQEWLNVVEEVLWHDEVGAWLDYDISNSIKRDYFSPTNIAPLWTGCYNKTDTNRIVSLVLKYLQNKNIMYPGGVPTTFEHTGEQWDYPNAWPPLQHMMIAGLNNTGDAYAQRTAFEIAEKWVRSNYKAFKETDAMFEKYDTTFVGGHGAGGEYQLQLGFGWTNGIIMDLLHRYSDKLTVEDPKTEAPALTSPLYSQSATSYSQISTALIALLISLTAGFIGVCIYKRRNTPTSMTNSSKKPSRSRYTELRNMTAKSSRSAR